jgi:hypothetical protein
MRALPIDQQVWQTFGADVQIFPLLHCDVGAGQSGVCLHEPAPPQLVSHLHEDEHWITPPQLFGPPHETLHAPAPQVVAPAQLMSPPHETEHDDDVLQSTPPAHEFMPAQSTMHAKPAGQTTWLAHEPAVSHVITHVLPLHDEHAGGHTNASALPLPSAPPGASGVPFDTHQPASQVRPVGQAPLSQRNAPDRVSIEQLQPIAIAASESSIARITRRLRSSRPRDRARPTARSRRRDRRATIATTARRR